VQFKSVKPTAVSIAGAVILLTAILSLIRPEVVERLERMTYDSRVRTSRMLPPPAATNLGFVFISDDSIRAVGDGSLGFRYGLYWPRHVYGRLLRELSAQEARAVAFDIVFSDLRADHDALKLPAESGAVNFLKSLRAGQPPETFSESGQDFALVESDEYFAWQLRASGNAILAGEHNVRPHPLFATNAWAVADISADADADGVLRRARVFQDYKIWHPVLLKAEADGLCMLRGARMESSQLVIPREGETDLIVPLSGGANIDLADFIGGPSRLEPALHTERVWHMGVQLAAAGLGLDLARSRVDLKNGAVTLYGSNNVERVIPVDANGYMFINWEIPISSDALLAESVESLLALDRDRSSGQSESITNRWRHRLVVVGSSAVGNDLTDHGSTPLEKDTLLASKHWNVANSIISARYVQRSSALADVLAIVGLGILSALISWRMRGFTATGCLLLLAVAYLAGCFAVFIQQRYWMSLVLPLGGALFVQYAMLVTYRVVFEERERRRTKSIFSRLVAPEIVSEVLNTQIQSLSGARRTVTVLFADIRGFTEFTDLAQERAEASVRGRNLDSMEAEVCYTQVARETLETVNLYLATVSGLVKQHHGVLDKYIGDCVMAFWGGLTPNPQHALSCVRMAIEAQRAIHELNNQREKQNRAIEIENLARKSAGLPLKPNLALLSLGTGINTGPVYVGLMGSDAHLVNYTVFGREVNLASRLESISGRGRIIVSETTLAELRRDDPALAARCIELESATPKGFQKPIRIFEVPWQSMRPVTP
jgi:class 3 adenylate cyclase/CHASE2 domain-containing sensor protein